jgi:hypothetical protein
MMFVAKPKVSNMFDAKEFDNVLDAVNYLNEYNELGKEFAGEDGNYASKLKAEDWEMIGKLIAPKGIYFRDNKVMGKVL